MMVESGASHWSSTSHAPPVELEKEEPLQLVEESLVDGTVWRKLDTWILPLLSMFYLLSTLDRTNIGNARVAGLQKSLAMSNYQFTLALTVTSLSLLASEFPFTLLLKYVGPDIMLPAVVTLWGVVSAVQGLVSNYAGLLVCRVFLGLLEGGLSPSIVLYLSFFYPRNRLQIRIATLFTAVSLSGAFSGLLAAAIGHMDGMGGRSGWAWIFILEGIFTSVFGVVSFFLLPRSPQKVRFLTEKERAYVVSTLKRTSSVSEHDATDRFRWTEFVWAVKSPHVWILTVLLFVNGATVNGLSYFEPTIVSELGYAGNEAQLMSVPPYVATFVLSIISAAISDRYGCRGYTAISFFLLELIGFTMFHGTTSASSHVRYVSLFFSVSGGVGSSPAVNTWLANNSAPYARRATAVAVAFWMIACGGILATWLFGWVSPAPEYTSVSIAFIAMSAVSVVLSTINLVYLRRENEIKAERRRRMRKEEEPEGLGDRSAWFIYCL